MRHSLKKKKKQDIQTNYNPKVGKSIEVFQPIYKQRKKENPHNFANSSLQRATLLGSCVPVLESQSNEMKTKVS